MVFALAVAVLGTTGTGFPVGSYKPDISKAPAKSRGLLAAYFGSTYLVVSPGGHFVLCGIEQEGRWRQEGNRFVFVYDGFFSMESRKPDDVLLKRWPKTNLEGMVLRRGAGGTLTLSDFGIARGPVIFRPMPKRTVAQLLVASFGDDLTPAMEEAFATFHDRVEGEWPEVLRFINDPARPGRQRNWAAIMLSGLRDPKGVEAAAHLILNLKQTSTNNRNRVIERSLAGVVRANPTHAAADLLLLAERRGILRPASVAPVLGQLMRRGDVPTLITWLGSERASDKVASLEALAVIGASEGLAHARTLASDPDEDVQLAAYGLVARTSEDSSERKAAVLKLSSWLKSTDFLVPFEAVDALCRSNAPEALPHLAALMISDMPAINRRNTAIALGELGDPRAVPVLIEAKLREDGPGSWVQESQVRRAAADALVRIGKSKLKRSA